MERSHYRCFQEEHVVGFVLWLLISRIRSRCSLSTYFIMQQETKGNDKWILHYFTDQCNCLPTRYGKTEDLRGVSSYSRRMDTIVVQSPASKWWICLMSSVSLIPRCSMRVITFDILLCINGRSSYYSTVILPTSFYCIRRKLLRVSCKMVVQRQEDCQWKWKQFCTTVHVFLLFKAC